MDSETASILKLRCLGFSAEIQTPKGKWTEVLKADQLRQERKGLSVSILRPRQIIEWSNGVVSDTVAVSFGKPNRRGLLSPNIFGRNPSGSEYPVGHIEFPCPIPHPWFFGVNRSLAGILLSMTDDKVLKIALDQIHVVTDAGTSGLQVGEEISAKENDISFESDTGEPAISKLLAHTDLDSVKRRVTIEMAQSSKEDERALLTSRLGMIEELFGSGDLQESLFLHVLPVLPAKLRPLKPLEGTQVGLGPINEAYQEVVVRCGKLRDRLREGYAFGMPIVAAKTYLYQAVDELLGLSVFREGLGDDFSYIAKDLGLVQLTPEEIEICQNREKKSKDAGATEVLESELQKLGETEITALGKQRVGQYLFRKRLIEKWGGCAVTGLKNEAMLRASHAKPWCDCETDEERLDVYNGFLLSVQLDALFDSGLMTFEDSGEARFSDKISEEDLVLLGVGCKTMLRTALDVKHLEYLEWHRDHVFKS